MILSIVFPDVFKLLCLKKILFYEVNDRRIIYVNKSRIMISCQKGINILYIFLILLQML